MHVIDAVLRPEGHPCKGQGETSSGPAAGRRPHRPHPTLLQDPWVALFQKHAPNLECNIGANTTAPPCPAKKIFLASCRGRPWAQAPPGTQHKRLIRRAGAGQSAGFTWIQRRLLLH